MLPHKMASEMECGLKQCGIFCFLVSYRVTLPTSQTSHLIDQNILLPLPFEHVPPIHADLFMNYINVLMS